jgi:hypothetical protein
MTMLLENPMIALAPAILFAVLSVVLKRRSILAIALLWFAYIPYEYAMLLRILCSGECNIRVDLLLIYPVLLASSVAGLMLAAHGYMRFRSGN